MADALIAFRNADEGAATHAGAMLIAEGLSNLRLCAEFVKAFAKGKR